MKRWSYVVGTILILSLLTNSAYAGPPDLERVVFVHYPKAPPAAVGLAKGNATATSSTCPDPSTCADFKWGGQKWFATPSYVLNATGSGLSNSTVAAAVSAAFNSWTSRTTDLGTVSSGTGSTDCAEAGVSLNSANQLCWRDLSSSYPNAIAVTFVWYYRFNKQIVEADTVFNNATGFAWSYTNPGSCLGYADCNAATGTAGRYDVRNIATHEFGHFLALFGDLYAARDGELTMYGYGATGELKKDSLGKGDCLAITRAYGGTCP